MRSGRVSLNQLPMLSASPCSQLVLLVMVEQFWDGNISFTWELVRLKRMLGPGLAL